MERSRNVQSRHASEILYQMQLAGVMVSTIRISYMLKFVLHDLPNADLRLLGRVKDAHHYSSGNSYI